MHRKMNTTMMEMKVIQKKRSDNVDEILEKLNEKETIEKDRVKKLEEELRKKCIYTCITPGRNSKDDDAGCKRRCR